MLALKRRSATASVSEITYEVIRMPYGVAESLVDEDDGEQQFSRLEALCEAAKAFERQAEAPSLASGSRKRCSPVAATSKRRKAEAV